MNQEVVDGYCHCGTSKYRPIEDIGKVMGRFGVSRAVLVQHLGEFDNRYIERVAGEDPGRWVQDRKVT